MNNRAATQSLIVILFVLALPFALWAAWSFYDGLVTYPNQRERGLAYEQLQADYPQDWQTRWDEMANEKGWSSKDPGKPRTEADFITQYVMGGFCSFLAVICAATGVLLLWLNKRSAAAALSEQDG